jgi:hypothetical protein
MSVLARVIFIATVLLLSAGSNGESNNKNANLGKSGGSITGTYADENLSYEFTSERVYITAPFVGTSATNYELDGKRILVGVAGQQQVLTILDDGSLQGPMGIVLKKQSGSIKTSDSETLRSAQDANSPGAAAEAYMVAMSELDLETAMTHVVDGDQFISTQPPAQIAAIKAGLKSKLDSQGGVTEFRVVDEQIIGNEAMVEVESRFGNGETEKESLTFVKQGGRWLLD